MPYDRERGKRALHYLLSLAPAAMLGKAFCPHCGVELELIGEKPLQKAVNCQGCGVRLFKTATSRVKATFNNNIWIQADVRKVKT